MFRPLVLLMLIITAVISLAPSFAEPTGAPVKKPAQFNFQPGQVYSYKTREQDKGSTFTVCKIDEMAGRKIVSVRLDGLHIKNATAPGGESTIMGHVPIDEAVLARSTLKLERSNAPISRESLDGYAQWKQASDAGHAGFFTITLDDVVNKSEYTINHGTKKSQP